MGKEMCCFSTLQKTTLHHCYHTETELNWSLSQLMTVIADIFQWSRGDSFCRCKERYSLPRRWIQGCFLRLGGPPRRVSHRHRWRRATSGAPTPPCTSSFVKPHKKPGWDGGQRRHQPGNWTSRVFSCIMVVVKFNKLRIPHDPRNLNTAIRREHYQMPTVEEVTTRLAQSKKFTVLDAKGGFWQKRFDTESSYTFELPSRFW